MSTLIAPCALECSLNRDLDSHRGGDESTSFAKEYLRKKAFSKYTTGTIPSHAVASAQTKFLSVVRRMVDLEIAPRDMFEEYLLGHFVKRSREFFDTIDPADFSPVSLNLRSGVGPGKSIAANGTDFLRKLYYGPTSATSLDVLHLYLKSCATNPLDYRAAKCGLDMFGCVVTDCSRTSFVEKNVDEARTIATEPSLNMYFQLAIGDVINRHLYRRYGWHKSHAAEVNRALANDGSRDGLTATLDLQSASDSVSLQLVKMALPPYIYEMLCLLRCGSFRR